MHLSHTQRTGRAVASPSANRRESGTGLLAGVTRLQALVGNRVVSRLVASARIVQRDSDAANNYTADPQVIFTPAFRTNHTTSGQPFTTQTAMAIHDVRGSTSVQTLVDITDRDAANELYDYLQALSRPDSQRLANVHEFFFTTANRYPVIETQPDPNSPSHYHFRTARARLHVKVQWRNDNNVVHGGYYQIGHLSYTT